MSCIVNDGDVLDALFKVTFGAGAGSARLGPTFQQVSLPFMVVANDTVDT